MERWKRQEEQYWGKNRREGQRRMKNWKEAGEGAQWEEEEKEEDTG